MTAVCLPFKAIFQFTPLREGRLAGDRREGFQRAISIHAPPRGATNLAESRGLRMAISIHAPPRGATIFIGSCPLNKPKFQFTPLREGRRGYADSR